MNAEDYFFRRKFLYDHSEGVIHIEAVLGYISIMLTISTAACYMLHRDDPMFILVFAALAGLAGLIVSWVVIIDAARNRRKRRVLTAILGNLMSLVSLIADVFLFMVHVLHIVPAFFVSLV